VGLAGGEEKRLKGDAVVNVLVLQEPIAGRDLSEEAQQDHI